MSIIKQFSLIILFVSIITPISVFGHAVISMVQAIHQIKAQLHDYTEQDQNKVIDQMKKRVNKQRLIEQRIVTQFIEKAQSTLPAPKITDTPVKTNSNADADDDTYNRNLMRAIEASKHDAYSRLFTEHPVYGLIVRKIDSLRTLPLTQLCACNETDPNKSGSQSIRNAWAIAQLIEENTLVTAENIQTKALERPDIIQEVDGDLEGLMARAELLNLSSAYIVECTENRLAGYYISSDPTLIPFSILHVQQLLRTYREQDRWVVSFICKLGTQHFLVSLIKQEGQEPELIYLDPQNRQLTQNSYIHQCVQQIHRMCLEQSLITRVLNNLRQTFVDPIVNTVRRIAQWITRMF